MADEIGLLPSPFEARKARAPQGDGEVYAV
jgi:hypothetical protein